jgi:hypothetical protein
VGINQLTFPGYIALHWNSTDTGLAALAALEATAAEERRH